MSWAQVHAQPPQNTNVSNICFRTIRSYYYYGTNRQNRQNTKDKQCVPMANRWMTECMHKCKNKITNTAQTTKKNRTQSSSSPHQDREKREKIIERNARRAKPSRAVASTPSYNTIVPTLSCDAAALSLPPPPTVQKTPPRMTRMPHNKP